MLYNRYMAGTESRQRKTMSTSACEHCAAHAETISQELKSLLVSPLVPLGKTHNDAIATAIIIVQRTFHGGLEPS